MYTKANQDEEINFGICSVRIIILIPYQSRKLLL